MGRATESHFAVLNTKIQERKKASKTFNPDKIIDPALRNEIKPQESNNKELLKI